MEFLSFQPPLLHTDCQLHRCTYTTVTDTQGAGFGSVAQGSCSHTSGHI